MSTLSLNSSSADDLPSGEMDTPTWLKRMDEFAERFGDSVNPILVKETRQALKSRQFVVTFSVLLVAAFGWTVAGSLSMMPHIYNTPSAGRMLIGYYVVLALPMLLVVPLAAYRSLEAEIDDGTLELLSITALSPWQIVLGKLASASLQMMLYLVTLFPCVAYAYTLRGVDLPTLGLMMAILILAALTLTVVALSFAPLARGRSGRITTLLVVMMILLLAEYLVGGAAIGLIYYGNPLTAGWTVYLFVLAVFLSVVICNLLLTTTAAQLTPESENRSSAIRWSLLLVTAVLAAFVAFAIEWINEDREQVLFIFFPSMMFLAGLWTFAGALMAAESSAITPRIQRELPGNFLSRLMLTFFTPGPATGLVFACLGAIVVAGVFFLAIERIQDLGGSVFSNREYGILRRAILAYTSYLIVFLVLTRGIVALVRINNNPRVEVGAAALIAVGVLTALVPYAVQLHWNDYMPFQYSGWQITNWVWTLGMVLDNRLPMGIMEYLLLAMVIAVFIAIATVGRRALPIKTATPEAVLAAQQNGEVVT